MSRKVLFALVLLVGGVSLALSGIHNQKQHLRGEAEAMSDVPSWSPYADHSRPFPRFRLPTFEDFDVDPAAALPWTR